MKNFLEKTQLFWANPNYSGRLILILSVISALMLVIGIIIWFAAKNKAEKIPPYGKLRGKLTSIFATTGAIGLFLSLFAWQEIPYLSSRLLILFLAVIFIIWTIYILVYIMRDFSRELAKREQDERYKKYLPRKKAG